MLLRLLLCVALAASGVGHAAPAPASSRAQHQPCHDVARDAGMDMAAGMPAMPEHRSTVPSSHRRCAPDACHCVGSSAALGTAATPPGVDRPVRRGAWSSTLSTRYDSIALDALLRPPIG